MSTDPLTPVWARLDSPHPIFLQPEAADFPPGGWDRVAALGILRELRPAEFTTCTGCGEVARVVRLTTAGGVTTLRGTCRECGPILVEPDALRRWEVDVPALLGRVAAAAGVRSGLEAVVPGRLWYVGTARWAGRPRQVYFARAVFGPPRAAVAAALGPHPRAVVLHPTERAGRAWAATPNPGVGLDAVVAAGPAGLAFDVTAVEARLSDSEPVATPGESDPQPRRGVRLANIELLVKEVREILRAAREDMYARLAMGGPAELLPRPTQKALGERVGLSESDVSRCLADRAGALLKHLWAAVLDIDQVMAFKG
ncbi:MAG TPA: hypothetical protein VD866_04670 [Urbifossiella sp.]|nr:hypothetical protein [Urbifossiella sp.]